MVQVHRFAPVCKVLSDLPLSLATIPRWVTSGGRPLCREVCRSCVRLVDKLCRSCVGIVQELY